MGLISSLFNLINSMIVSGAESTYSKFEEAERQAKRDHKELPEKFYENKGKLEDGARAYEQFVEKVSKK